MTRPTILIFVSHYLPGFKAGGPVRSISNLVDQLSNTYDFWIVTRDRDLGDTRSYALNHLNNWVLVAGAQVMYVNNSWFGIFKVIFKIRGLSPDIVYINSFFDIKFSQFILWLIKSQLFLKAAVVMSVRGELSPGALSYKKTRKLLFIHLFKVFRLYRRVLWQASSKIESSHIRRIFPDISSTDICISPNLGPLKIPDIRQFKNRIPFAPLRVCFLARISPIKNLLFALDVLDHIDFDVVFTIIGPVSDLEYWSRCQQKIATLRSNISIETKGGIPHELVSLALSNFDLFFLPSKGENFGHVIREALSCGLPVLISDQTPWQHLEKIGVGWSLSLDDFDAFVSAIQSVNLWSDVKRNEVRFAAINFVSDEEKDSRYRMVAIDMFNRALNRL